MSLKMTALSVVILHTATADRAPNGLASLPSRRPSGRLARDRGSGRGCGRVVAKGQPGAATQRSLPARPRNVRLCGRDPLSLSPSLLLDRARFPRVDSSSASPSVGSASSPCSAGYPPRGRSPLPAIGSAGPRRYLERLLRHTRDSAKRDLVRLTRSRVSEIECSRLGASRRVPVGSWTYSARS